MSSTWMGGVGSVRDARKATTSECPCKKACWLTRSGGDTSAERIRVDREALEARMAQEGARLAEDRTEEELVWGDSSPYSS